MNNFDIILTVFNRPEYTKRTVASLISSGAFAACQRLIVVDNHSTDPETLEFLDHLVRYEKTFVIRRPMNDGWASAVNDALGLSRAPYLLLSNNDVEYKNDFHVRMLDALEADRNKPVGLVGVWAHTGHGFTHGIYDGSDFREMDNVPAVGWMMPKYAMEKVGMLAEHGPCLTKGGNGEDTDYVMRMHANGFLVGVLAEDVAVHIDGY